MERSMTPRVKALTVGIAVAGLYVAGAVWSGRLSPLTRLPLLDGLAPTTPYRWVQPPPELEARNDEPTPGRFRVNFGASASQSASFTTDDAQVTVILPKGVFRKAPGRSDVELRIEPLAPSAVSAPDGPGQIVGNVYQLQATYLPSGREASTTSLFTVVLVYPAQANIHGEHTIIWSQSGAQWKSLDTDDSTITQQAGANLRTLGYVAVTGTPTTPTEMVNESEGNLSRTLLLAGIVALGVIAVGVFIQSTLSLRSARRELESDSRAGPSPSRSAEHLRTTSKRGNRKRRRRRGKR